VQIAMKKSIDQICHRPFEFTINDLDKQKRMTHNTRVEVPPTVGEIKGNVPCARDGHTAHVTRIGRRDKMVVFGGDRFKVSFYDIFLMDLKKMNQVIEKKLK
jgi:hypothetical protein